MVCLTNKILGRIYKDVHKIMQVSETWTKSQVSGSTKFMRLNLNNKFRYVSSIPDKGNESESVINRAYPKKSSGQSTCNLRLNLLKGVNSYLYNPNNSASVSIIQTSLFKPSNYNKSIFQNIQKRFYGKKADPCKDAPPSTGGRPLPDCMPEIKKPPTTVCPPIIKSEGNCCRVKMPGCKKSCRYHRKFCCVKQTRKPCKRIRTPRPCFSECYDLDLWLHPECECHAPRSPCAHDERPRFKPKKTRTCS